jgi:hypothetical protein
MLAIDPTMPSGQGGAVPAAAVAKATHDVLVSRFPSASVIASLDTAYHNYLAAHGLSETDPGVAVGAQAAAGIIALRACDGSFPIIPPPPFVGGTAIGMWRPTPPAFAPMLAPWLANVTPFTLTRPSQFRAGPPPALSSNEYARDYNEVRTVGGINSAFRPQDRTDVARFYATSSPGFVFNLAARQVATAVGSSLSKNARVLALLNMASNDALVASFWTKYHYNFWRPETAIHEGSVDGNPRTDGDIAYMPYILTPCFPSYPSNHGSGSNSAAEVLQKSSCLVSIVCL